MAGTKDVNSYSVITTRNLRKGNMLLHPVMRHGLNTKCNESLTGCAQGNDSTITLDQNNHTEGCKKCKGIFPKESMSRRSFIRHWRSPAMLYSQH